MRPVASLLVFAGMVVVFGSFGGRAAAQSVEVPSDLDLVESVAPNAYGLPGPTVTVEFSWSYTGDSRSEVSFEVQRGSFGFRETSSDAVYEPFDDAVVEELGDRRHAVVDQYARDGSVFAPCYRVRAVVDGVRSEFATECAMAPPADGPSDAGRLEDAPTEVTIELPSPGSGLQMHDVRVTWLYPVNDFAFEIARTFFRSSTLLTDPEIKFEDGKYSFTDVGILIAGDSPCYSIRAISGADASDSVLACIAPEISDGDSGATPVAPVAGTGTADHASAPLDTWRLVLMVALVGGALASVALGWRAMGQRR